MSTHSSIHQMQKMLANSLAWLDKASAHAKAKKFEPDAFLSSRLAPDQYAFVRQLQAACDTVKLAAARLAGREAPKHPDTEATVEQIRGRIQAVIAYLDGFSEADFAGAETRVLELAFLPRGKSITGAHYLDEFVIPNFYFHVTTAYAILRHDGVDLGKYDYIGSLELKDVTPG